MFNKLYAAIIQCFIIYFVLSRESKNDIINLNEIKRL